MTTDDTERMAGEPSWVLLDICRLDSIEAAIYRCVEEYALDPRVALRLAQHVYLAVLDALLA